MTIPYVVGIRDNISANTIENTSFIIKEDTGEILELDEVGSYLWTKIDGVKSVEEIATICSQDFDGDPNDILKEIIAFFEELYGLGIISVVKEREIVQ